MEIGITIGAMALMWGVVMWFMKITREDINKNHKELKDLLIGHFHTEDGKAAFRLPTSSS